MYYKEKFQVYKEKFDKKIYKKLGITNLIKIIDILENKDIQDEVLANHYMESIEMLDYYDSYDKVKKKAYKRKYSLITNHVNKEYKLVAEGTYIGIGMALGVALSSAFSGSTIGFPISIGVGIAIGMAIGAYLEDKAKKEGKLY